MGSALVPKPRHNLVRYHGVFAPNSKMRKLIVPKKSTESIKHTKEKDDEETQKTLNRADLFSPLTWAQRLKRAGVHIQFLPKALSGILRGYLIASIVVSVRNTEFETLILNFQLPLWLRLSDTGYRSEGVNY
jgi:hypothetical protein